MVNATSPDKTCAVIHPEDHLYRFVRNRPFIEDEEAARACYFQNGRTSAAHLKRLIDEFRRPGELSLLEFASGYGAVTRYLADVIPGADVTAVDIHPAAVEFVEREIGVRALLSTSEPEAFPINDRFDVVFAISFFSHMPRSTWARWLRTLAARVKTNGLLIFTTHGLASLNHMPHLIPKLVDGFAFEPYSEQVDLDTAEYGNTVSAFDFVYREIAQISPLRLVKFNEAFWYGHQDVYVLKSDPRELGGGALKPKQGGEPGK